MLIWLAFEFCNDDVIQLFSTGYLFWLNTISKIHHGWCVWLLFINFLICLEFYCVTTPYLSILLSKDIGLVSSSLLLWRMLLGAFLGLIAAVPYCPERRLRINCRLQSEYKPPQAAREFHLIHIRCQHFSVRLKNFCNSGSVKRYFYSNTLLP